MRRWTTDRRPGEWIVNESHPAATATRSQADRLPHDPDAYDAFWHDPQRLRAFVDGWAPSAPELFPVGFERGYRLHGFGRESRKLPGLKLRKIVTHDGPSYWLRPSFVAGYMTGTVDELDYPLLLAALGFPRGC